MNNFAISPNSNGISSSLMVSYNLGNGFLQSLLRTNSKGNPRGVSTLSHIVLFLRAPHMKSGLFYDFLALEANAENNAIHGYRSR